MGISGTDTRSSPPPGKVTGADIQTTSSCPAGADPDPLCTLRDAWPAGTPSAVCGWVSEVGAAPLADWGRESPWLAAPLAVLPRLNAVNCCALSLVRTWGAKISALCTHTHTHTHTYPHTHMSCTVVWTFSMLACLQVYTHRSGCSVSETRRTYDPCSGTHIALIRSPVELARSPLPPCVCVRVLLTAPLSSTPLAASPPVCHTHTDTHW